MKPTFVAVLATAALAYPTLASAQGVVVDQGRFAITLAGRPAGSEDFVIRRAGLGREDAVFANGVVSITVTGRQQEIRPLLRAIPPEGVAEGYQVKVTGPEAMDLRLARVARRFVATISSGVGQEEREFQAKADTRVVERDVAHHYYFLKDIRDAQTVSALEPRSRRQFGLTAGIGVEQELQLGQSIVEARRVEFTSEDGDSRVVWFDRLGRVLRVEIPSLRYVAERTDLVG